MWKQIAFSKANEKITHSDFIAIFIWLSERSNLSLTFTIRNSFLCLNTMKTLIYIFSNQSNRKHFESKGKKCKYTALNLNMREIKFLFIMPAHFGIVLHIKNLTRKSDL